MMYEIKIQGNVDPSWSDWLNGLTLRAETHPRFGCVTALTGPVTDQAALRGILNRLWDLNLCLISVTEIETRSESGSYAPDERS